MISAHGLWKKGESIDYAGYRTLMALAYLKWVTMLPVRRLEYNDSRFVTPAAFNAMTTAEKEKGNWVVTGNGLGSYSTSRHSKRSVIRA